MLTNWKREAEAFTPELAVKEHLRTPPPLHTCSSKESLKDVDLVLTSYGLLQRDIELLASQDCRGCIDEAQAIKNPGAKQLAARELARSRKGAFPHRPHRHPGGEPRQ